MADEAVRFVAGLATAGVPDDEADVETASGGFVAARFVAGAAIGTPAFGAISVISIGFCTILDISMSPSGGVLAVITAGGGGAGVFNKAGLIAPLSESNAAFTLSAKLFASIAFVMMGCASTTCFKLGILVYNALPILPPTFDCLNFPCMYDRTLFAAATKVGSQDDVEFRLRHVLYVF